MKRQEQLLQKVQTDAAKYQRAMAEMSSAARGIAESLATLAEDAADGARSGQSQWDAARWGGGGVAG